MAVTIKKIGDIALEAMLFEVSATPKPGLVDRNNNGAHRDMDYFTFMRSATALRGAFGEFARTGREHAPDGIENLLSFLQAEGIAAERSMFAATKGVNTHKGMIFSLGILCGAAGFALGSKQVLTAEILFDLSEKITSGLTAAAYGDIGKKPAAELTKGERMFLKYGVTGVRGEAESGFASVKNIALPIYRQRRNANLSVNDALVDTLLYLIAGTYDTNILGRHDMAALIYARNYAKDAISAGGMETKAGRAKIAEMDRAFIEHWISPGGSADLLAVTHFVYEIEKSAKDLPVKTNIQQEAHISKS